MVVNYRQNPKHLSSHPQSTSYNLTMAVIKSSLLVALAAAAATTHAQSANPGVGTNPKAQGATEQVTPSSGPNG